MGSLDRTTSLLIHNTIEKILGCCAFCIAAFHLILATFIYVIPINNYTAYIRWAGVSLLFMAISYLVGCVIFSKTYHGQITGFLRRISTFEQILLTLLFLWFCISCFANGIKLDNLTVLFQKHDWFLFDMAVCFFILFPMSRYLGFKKAKRAIQVLIHIVVIPYTVFTVFCLWHIFHLEVLNLPSGEVAGMTYEAELMLGRHYNLTGMISATMFILSVYFVFSRNEWIIRSIYIICLFVHLIVVYLCNSRTVFIGCLFSAVYITFFLCWHAIKNKFHKFRLLISILISICVGFAFWMCRDLTFLVFEKVTHFSEELAAVSNSLSIYRDSYSLSKLLFRPVRTDFFVPLNSGINSARDLTSGLSNRENIWVAALKVISYSRFNAVFGVTPAMVTDSLQKIGGYWTIAAHAHNSILQTGVSMGVPAMVLLIAFILCITVRCVRICLLSSRNTPISAITISSGIMCCILVNMAEAYLIAYFSIMSCVFFLLCGFVVSLDETNEQTEKKSKKRKNLYRILILAVAIALSVLMVLFASNFLNINPDRLSGRGTWRDPYLIEDVSDLKYFRDLVNRGFSFEGSYFVQTDDLDLQNKEWKPIGVYGKYSFDGYYYGGNHTIKNLYISKTNIKNPQRAALFGFLKGVVTNLSVESGSIYGTPINTGQNTSSNLLLGTNRGTENYTLGDNGYGAVISSENNAVKVSMSSRNEQGWLVLLFSDMRSKYLLSGQKGERYTLSFQAKSNIEDATILISHKNGNSQEMQIDFGRISTGVSNEWHSFKLTGSLTGVGESSQALYFDLRNNPVGTEIFIKDLKLEYGEETTPWADANDSAIAVSGRVNID